MEQNPYLRNLTQTQITTFFQTNPNFNPHKALIFFNFLSKRSNFRHGVDSFSSLLQILIKNRVFSVAQNMRILMVKACLNEEDARFVLRIIRELNKEAGFKVSVRCYNTMLMCLSSFLMIHDMKCLFLEMLDDGEVLPNIYTYNTMVNAYCKLGKVDVASLYVSKIFQAGLRPDTHTYTSLILGHCRNKDVDSAFKVFELMPRKGCQRNEVSYTNLIHGLCEETRV